MEAHVIWKCSPKTGVEHGPYPRNHRVGGPTPSPIHDLTGFCHCLIGPELQEHAEVHPCLLGLSMDTFFLVDRISWVFRDGKIVPSYRPQMASVGMPEFPGWESGSVPGNSVAQSMMANTSIAALSAPAPKNLMEWTSS